MQFERLIWHPAIVRGISQLTGFGDLQVWHDQMQYKPARASGATGWHPRRGKTRIACPALLDGVFNASAGGRPRPSKKRSYPNVEILFIMIY